MAAHCETNIHRGDKITERLRLSPALATYSSYIWRARIQSKTWPLRSIPPIVTATARATTSRNTRAYPSRVSCPSDDPILTQTLYCFPRKRF
ncbi:hypothetical protein Cob_v004251 [Colletotrichum orbiculare MAFF 240422]|uniref:Uncharacterized protein n=1 Tax=Colletotrichum orbiculare (strain 104-T / ATCC 96160 / CBS 514.97 / LARS 414 / MAFF 240422) TaxID=1213857 RepID=A0A484FXV2_COLOR|nr:hypothetical protein Cob_v004251 [Colletotrichum orbiculare MAFF 240422]